MPTINQLTDAVAALDTDQRARVVDAIVSTLTQNERADLANRICLETFDISTPRPGDCPVGADPISRAGLAFLEILGSVGAEALKAQTAAASFEASGAVESHPAGEAMFQALQSLSGGMNKLLTDLRPEIEALKAARRRGSN